MNHDRLNTALYGALYVGVANFILQMPRVVVVEPLFYDQYGAALITYMMWWFLVLVVNIYLGLGIVENHTSE